MWFDDFKVTFTPQLIVQENHYYPFGMTLKGMGKVNRPEHKFTYNGKEKQEEFGLNWLSYGQREHDPALGRFNRVDRFSEKYYDLNPYNYTGNNPINRIDINGDSIWITQEGKNNYTLHIHGKLLNFSGRNINLQRQAKEFKSDIENAIMGSYTGFRVGPSGDAVWGTFRNGDSRKFKYKGKNIMLKLDVNIKATKSIKDVESHDNIFIFADFDIPILEYKDFDGNSHTAYAKGVTTQTGGQVSYLNADKFKGFSLNNFWAGRRTAIHELGRQLGWYAPNEGHVSQGGVMNQSSLNGKVYDSHLINLMQRYEAARLGRTKFLNQGSPFEQQSYKRWPRVVGIDTNGISKFDIRVRAGISRLNVK